MGLLYVLICKYTCASSEEINNFFFSNIASNFSSAIVKQCRRQRDYSIRCILKQFLSTILPQASLNVRLDCNTSTSHCFSQLKLFFKLAWYFSFMSFYCFACLCLCTSFVTSQQKCVGAHQFALVSLITLFMLSIHNCRSLCRLLTTLLLYR